MLRSDHPTRHCQHFVGTEHCRSVATHVRQDSCGELFVCCGHKGMTSYPIDQFWEQVDALIVLTALERL